jgi:hypothetical protein
VRGSCCEYMYCVIIQRVQAACVVGSTGQPSHQVSPWCVLAAARVALLGVACACTCLHVLCIGHHTRRVQDVSVVMMRTPETQPALPGGRLGPEGAHMPGVKCRAAPARRWDQDLCCICHVLQPHHAKRGHLNKDVPNPWCDAAFVCQRWPQEPPLLRWHVSAYARHVLAVLCRP